MEWLMIVVWMLADDERREEKSFASRAACVAAAEEYVARYPELEWRDPSDELSIIRPVVRSTIRCRRVYEDWIATGQDFSICHAGVTRHSDWFWTPLAQAAAFPPPVLARRLPREARGEERPCRFATASPPTMSS